MRYLSILLFLLGFSLSHVAIGNTCNYSLALDGAGNDLAFIFSGHAERMAERGYSVAEKQSDFALTFTVKYTTLEGSDVTEELRADPSSAKLLYDQGYISIIVKVSDLKTKKSDFFAIQSSAIALPEFVEAAAVYQQNPMPIDGYLEILGNLVSKVFIQIPVCL